MLSPSDFAVRSLLTDVAQKARAIIAGTCIVKAGTPRGYTDFTVNRRALWEIWLPSGTEEKRKRLPDDDELFMNPPPKAERMEDD